MLFVTEASFALKVDRQRRRRGNSILTSLLEMLLQYAIKISINLRNNER